MSETQRIRERLLLAKEGIENVFTYLTNDEQVKFQEYLDNFKKVTKEFVRAIDGKVPKYILSEDAINGIDIKEVKLFEYRITDRVNFLDELIGWIGEAKGNNKVLMKEDLELLMNVKDDYIFSSISTNKYLYVGCDEFEETCKELLELNSEQK